MFDNNTAGIDGGAIDSFSKLILNKVNFQNNKASDGAAVKSQGSIDNSIKIKISNSQFNNNNANKGAGIFLKGASYAELNNLNLINNHASDGMIYNQASNNLTLNNTIFQDNIGGHVIFHESGYSLLISQCIINHTNATMDMIGCNNSYYRNQIRII